MNKNLFLCSETPIILTVTGPKGHRIGRNAPG
jgi:hypothetical protein